MYSNLPLKSLWVQNLKHNYNFCDCTRKSILMIFFILLLLINDAVVVPDTVVLVAELVENVVALEGGEVVLFAEIIVVGNAAVKKVQYCKIAFTWMQVKSESCVLVNGGKGNSRHVFFVFIRSFECLMYPKRM